MRSAIKFCLYHDFGNGVVYFMKSAITRIRSNINIDNVINLLIQYTVFQNVHQAYPCYD